MAISASACVSATNQGAPGKTASVQINTNVGQVFQGYGSASYCDLGVEPVVTSCPAFKTAPTSVRWSVYE